MKKEKNIMPNFFAIIPAAGYSTRFGGILPKQYQKINGKTVLEHSINCLLLFKELKKLIVVLQPGDVYWQNSLYNNHQKIETVIGGNTRKESVINGLHHLINQANNEDWIIVHDAVRPYLDEQDLHKLLTTVKHHSVGGILATPVVDTLKLSIDGKNIEKTISREGLYRALTPQCFRFSKLLSALKKAPENLTDESMALELAGHHPLLVIGKPHNHKITYQEDIL